MDSGIVYLLDGAALLVFFFKLSRISDPSRSGFVVLYKKKKTSH